MASSSHHRIITLAIILLSTIAGLVFMAAPVSAEETGPVYSAPSFSANALDVSIGNAPPGYFTTTRVTSGNEVSVTLSVLLGTANTMIFSASFLAGTFEISQISVGNGGTVFLLIESEGGVFTQLTVYARIFRVITTYPYSWIGLGVLGFAGLFTLVVAFPNTAFGKIAGKIIPAKKLGM